MIIIMLEKEELRLIEIGDLFCFKEINMSTAFGIVIGFFDKNGYPMVYWTDDRQTRMYSHTSFQESSNMTIVPRKPK